MAIDVRQVSSRPAASQFEPSDIKPAVEARMKALSHFVGTTILGGVLFLTPIVVLAFVLSKAFEFVSRGLKPVAALIPDRLATAPTATCPRALCSSRDRCARTHSAWARFPRGPRR